MFGLDWFVDVIQVLERINHPFSLLVIINDVFGPKESDFYAYHMENDFYAYQMESDFSASQMESDFSASQMESDLYAYQMESDFYAYQMKNDFCDANYFVDLPSIVLMFCTFVLLQVLLNAL